MFSAPRAGARFDPEGFDRQSMLHRLATEQFDVVVIGGGVTGVGVALDAASRGLRTALVERGDFASGTSSKSSKMVHGGLRYLQQGEIRLVYEALRERQRLRKNAPHLVSVLPFMIPILGRPPKPGDPASAGASSDTKSVVNRKIARALGSAMWMYDLTGGWRIGKLHRRLNKQATLAHMPTMPEARVLAAYLYYDAAVDDARLVVTIARTAAAHGAAIANACPVVGFTHSADGVVDGVTVEADGRRFDIDATVVVNASGVWSDQVRQLDDGIDPDTIRPAKGVHLTVPWAKVRNDIAVVIPVPKDKRSLFVVPWGPNADGTFRHAYVGTTDTDYSGPIDSPQCTADDVAYVLRALNASVDLGVDGPITDADVTGVWAGLRPLVKQADAGRTADLSRRHSITRTSQGVISVTGGKLTTYREMSEDTVDEVLEVLGRKARCKTRRLQLLGATAPVAPAGVPVVDATSSEAATHRMAHAEQVLVARHGSFAAEITRLAAADPTLLDPLVTGLEYLRVEVVWAVRHEMALTVDDVLSRRTRARLLDRTAAVAAARDVAGLMAPILGWDGAESARQVSEFVASCADEAAAGRVAEAEYIASVTSRDTPGGSTAS